MSLTSEIRNIFTKMHYFLKLMLLCCPLKVTGSPKNHEHPLSKSRKGADPLPCPIV